MKASSFRQAYWISKRYVFISGRIEQGPGLLDRLCEIRVLARPFFDKIDGVPEHVFQCQEQSKIGIGTLCRRKRLKLDQEIEIAPALLKLPGCSGTKERQLPDMVTPTKCFEFREVSRDERVH